MVIDSSAIIAILSAEPEATRFAEAIQDDSIRLMSAATLVETAIVIETRYGPEGSYKLDDLLKVAQVQIEPVTS